MRAETVKLLEKVKMWLDAKKRFTQMSQDRKIKNGLGGGSNDEVGFSNTSKELGKSRKWGLQERAQQNRGKGRFRSYLRMAGLLPQYIATG